MDDVLTHKLGGGFVGIHSMHHYLYHPVYNIHIKYSEPAPCIEQHLQPLPLDVSSAPQPPPPVRTRKWLQTLPKVPWAKIPPCSEPLF